MYLRLSLQAYSQPDDDGASSSVSLRQVVYDNLDAFDGGTYGMLVRVLLEPQSSYCSQHRVLRNAQDVQMNAPVPVLHNRAVITSLNRYNDSTLFHLQR